MTIVLRIILYFVGTFAASLAAGITDHATQTEWVRLIACSLGAGCAAVVAYLDKTSTPKE